MTVRTHTLEQPFARINTPTFCVITDRHAPQIVPVAGNQDRETPTFVVHHGRDYLTANGRVTTTPVWLTWTEAEAAVTRHAGTVSTGVRRP